MSVETYLVYCVDCGKPEWMTFADAYWSSLGENVCMNCYQKQPKAESEAQNG